MRILLFNEYFPPDTSATAKMAEAVVDVLAEHHEVVVMCGRPSYDPTERHTYYLFCGASNTATSASSEWERPRSLDSRWPDVSLTTSPIRFSRFLAR